MATEGPDLAGLLSRWRALSSGDRKAILRRLSPDLRRQFARMLTEVPKEGLEDDDARQMLRYRAYSPWLGRLVEACETDSVDATSLTPRTRETVLHAHARAENSLKRGGGAGSLLDFAHSIAVRWRNRL